MSKDLGARVGAQERRQFTPADEQRPGDRARCHRGAEAVGRVAAHFVGELERRLADIEGIVGHSVDTAAPLRPRQHDLSSVLDCARAGREVAQQFLAFARGRLNSPDWIDLAETLESLRPLLLQLAGSSIRLTLEADPCRLLVPAAAEGLARVVTGLVTDAADALPVGGTLVIRATLAADAASVALTVAPEGFGQQPMPEPANHDGVVASWGGTVRLACDHERHTLFYEVVLPTLQGEDG